MNRNEQIEAAYRAFESGANVLLTTLSGDILTMVGFDKSRRMFIATNYKNSVCLVFPHEVSKIEA